MSDQPAVPAADQIRDGVFAVFALVKAFGVLAEGFQRIAAILPAVLEVRDANGVVMFRPEDLGDE
jgi:hypothetical protein